MNISAKYICICFSNLLEHVEEADRNETYHKLDINVNITKVKLVRTTSKNENYKAIGLYTSKFNKSLIKMVCCLLNKIWNKHNSRKSASSANHKSKILIHTILHRIKEPVYFK